VRVEYTIGSSVRGDGREKNRRGLAADLVVSLVCHQRDDLEVLGALYLTFLEIVN